MTLTVDHDFFPTTLNGTVCKLGGGRVLARGGARIAAVALVISAVALWIAPGTSWASEVMLFKMLLSLCALASAAGIWQASQTPGQPIAEIDLNKREVRLVRNRPGTSPKVLERCAFGALARAELRGRHISFWAEDDRLVVEVSLNNATAHAALLGALRAEGKLR